MNDIFTQAGVPLSKDQEEKFALLLRFFMAKNEQLNLSAIRDAPGIIEKHFVDSLSALQCSSFQKAKTVLDLGTGGGFPGLPLAIMEPDKSFTLLDGTRKKVEAVSSFAHDLGLDNVQTVWGRAEDRGKWQEINAKGRKATALNTLYPLPHTLLPYTPFDCVLARAVTALPDLLTLAKPHLSDDGVLIAYKLENSQERADGIRKAASIGMRLLQEIQYRLPSSPQERVLLVFARSVIGKKREK